MRLCLSAACLVSVLLAGCPADEEQDDGAAGGRMSQTPPSDPSGKPGEDPTGPGLEPPTTTDPGSTPTPGGMQGTGGSAAGNAGNPPVQPPPASEPDSDAGADSCGAPCGASAPCAGDGALHCIVVPACGSGAVCITPEAACMLECDTPSCALLESYPEQIRCE